MKKQVPVIQGSILNNIGKNVIHYKIMHIGLRFLRNRFTDTDTEDTEIDKILDDDIIEPSSGPWASPILLVKKKDCSIRFCIDYRKINVVVKKNAYPLPRTDECLEVLSGSKFMFPMFEPKLSKDMF